MKHHPVFDKWPPKHRDRIQLYSIASPNGIKVAMALKETGLPYEPHLVNLFEKEQFAPEFVALSPNSKIPAIIDPDGPGGELLPIMESGAILLHLADKSGRLLPRDPLARSECIQWLFFQAAHIGPMFGQFEHFYRLDENEVDISYPRERYRKEAMRLLQVLDTRLDGGGNIMGDDYTIADIATLPWVRNVKRECAEVDHLDLASFGNVNAWFDRSMARPASQAGMKVCDIPGA